MLSQYSDQVCDAFFMCFVSAFQTFPSKGFGCLTTKFELDLRRHSNTNNHDGGCQYHSQNGGHQAKYNRLKGLGLAMMKSQTFEIADKS